MKRRRRKKKSSSTENSDTAAVTCPYCFEELELFVDPDVEGSYVQDCEVCCNAGVQDKRAKRATLSVDAVSGVNPWQITVTRDEEGRIVADVGRAQ